MSRILITGASGFIGKYAVRLAIERGLDVHAVVSPRHADAHIDGATDGATVHALDLLGDAGAMQQRIRAIGATHALHLAWYAVPGKFWNAPENTDWLEATVALANAFGEGGGTRFVGAGTCAEYAWTSGMCDERTTPCTPATPYGIAKDSARRRLESWAAQTSISFAWARIFFLYGPGEARERLIPSIILALANGESAAVTDGTQRRDFLHVRDVADALLALLLSDVRGPVNIASGEPVAIRDVVARIGEELHASDRIRYGAIPMRDGDPELLAGNATRLTNEVGWHPHFELASGLRDTIDWWTSSRERN